MPPITEDQRRNNFRRQLQDAIDTGKFPATDEGLRLSVLAAIRRVAEAYPNPTAVQIRSAKEAFESQLVESISLNDDVDRYAGR